MAEQDTLEAPSEVEVEAKSLGWVPEAEFKGKKDRWVDAATFVERGHTVLPIMKENNQRLQEDNARTRAEIAALKETLKATQATIAALEESREADVQERVKAAKKDLKEQLKAAKAAGDVDAEVELTEQLGDLNAAAAKPAEKKEEQKATPAVNPLWTAWLARPENSWFGVDMRKTGLAEGIARDLRAKGDMSSGDAFMDKVVAEVNAILERRPAGGKVESGGRGNGARGNGKSYEDLPAEAKAQCDKDAKRLVGANRAHKDVASWRKSYAEQYFRE